jgi:hypothetical protein
MKGNSTRGGWHHNEQLVYEWVRKSAASEQKLIYKTLLLGLASLYLWLLMSFLV